MGRPAKYPVQEFNGRRFYRRPGPAGYYRSDPKYGGRYMHRVVWEHFHGPIPDDHHIHHIDGDPANNAIENLEAIHSRDHAVRHWQEDGPHSCACEAWLATIRPMAAKARQHPIVRRKLSDAAKKGATQRVMLAYVCEHCGEEYRALSGYRHRFCSRACKHYARLASGVDNETRQCAGCGSDFTVNRYARATYCSKSCGGRAAASQRNAGRL
ncbi:MAG: HNH endonuclease signature motif containing protein [Phycisphaerales bacterium]